MALPLRIDARPPLTATGTTGAWACSAMMKPPFLNGSSSPVRLRVPSGKIRNELPWPSDATAASTDANDLRRSARSTATNPPRSNAIPISGTLVELGLIEDMQHRIQPLEQHGRVHVAFVVGAIDDSPIGNVLPADDAVADARQPQSQPDAAVADRSTAAASTGRPGQQQRHGGPTSAM